MNRRRPRSASEGLAYRARPTRAQILYSFCAVRSSPNQRRRAGQGLNPQRQRVVVLTEVERAIDRAREEVIDAGRCVVGLSPSDGRWATVVNYPIASGQPRTRVCDRACDSKRGHMLP